MKIHTSLTYNQMYELIRDSGASISYHKLERAGSRTHAYAYHVTLEGTGGQNNTGLYGAGDYNGATWDEWGAFFGALYARDAEARCGGTVTNPTYKNFTHFHYLTGDRFQNIAKWSATAGDNGKGGYAPCFLPADAHPRHQWTWRSLGNHFYDSECRKCSAKRPVHIEGKDWS